jgi:hypothetical protein
MSLPHREGPGVLTFHSDRENMELVQSPCSFLVSSLICMCPLILSGLYRRSPTSSPPGPNTQNCEIPPSLPILGLCQMKVPLCRLSEQDRVQLTYDPGLAQVPWLCSGGGHKEQEGSHRISLLELWEESSTHPYML